jgi:hypothetical protein
MQSRILQVTHLGNFHPWLPWNILDDDHARNPKEERVASLAPVYSAIVRLRGSSRPDDNDSALVAESLGEYIVSFRSRDHAASHPMWANYFLCIRALCSQHWYLWIRRIWLFPLNY